MLGGQWVRGGWTWIAREIAGTGSPYIDEDIKLVESFGQDGNRSSLECCFAALERQVWTCVTEDGGREEVC